MGVILGFDPGGQGKPGGPGNFGWSICRIAGGSLEPPAVTGLARDAWDALIQVQQELRRDDCQEHAPLAAGIDAPMFWSKRRKRTVDGVRRKALRAATFPPKKLGGTVQAVNALQGAVTVQGTLLGRHLRATWGNLRITEAHPTAIQHLLCHSGEPHVVYMVQRLTEGLVTHKRDATLAAVGAWAMLRQPDGWRNLYDQECCPVQPFDTPVSYWMPIPPEIAEDPVAPHSE